MNFHGAREGVTQSGLKTAAPSGRLRRKATQREKEWCEIETRIESPTAVETGLLRVQFVEIMQNSAIRIAFVVVERMFEETDTASAAVEHQVFPDETGRVGQAVWKL